MAKTRIWLVALLSFAVVSGCRTGGEPDPAPDVDDGGIAEPEASDAGPSPDTNAPDGGEVDAGEVDAGHEDGGTQDAGGGGNLDAGDDDAGMLDAGEVDAGGSRVVFECLGDDVPHSVIRSFWMTIDRNYAVFGARVDGADWASAGNTACDSVDANTPDQALFIAVTNLAKVLDDGHVTLVAPALGLESDGQQNEFDYDLVDDRESVVEAAYLDEDLSWGAQDYFAWGIMNDVGYISLTSFDDLSNGGDEAPDRAAANTAIATAINDLSSVTGIIVDVRANEGGWDSVALDVARYFEGPRTLAWSKQVRDGSAHDAYASPVDTFVLGSNVDAFTGPVIVLTSRGTFSAAETFVLAMSERPNVVVMGDPTSGHFSDLFDADLPNGWSMIFSGERYRAANGEFYEGIGVPVDVVMALDPTGISLGVDPMVVAAAARLTQ